MSHPYLHALLARERHNMLAEPEAIRLVKQARSDQRSRSAPVIRRSPLRRILALAGRRESFG